MIHFHEKLTTYFCCWKRQKSFTRQQRRNKQMFIVPRERQLKLLKQIIISSVSLNLDPLKSICKSAIFIIPFPAANGLISLIVTTVAKHSGKISKFISDLTLIVFKSLTQTNKNRVRKNWSTYERILIKFSWKNPNRFS